MNDRLREIRARLEAEFPPGETPEYDPEVLRQDGWCAEAAQLLGHAPADLAYLLDRVTELEAQRDRVADELMRLAVTRNDSDEGQGMAMAFRMAAQLIREGGSVADALDVILLDRPVPEGWTRRRWLGDRLPHLARRWDAPDPAQPAHYQRRCEAEVRVLDNGSVGYRLDVEDGPRQYFGWRRGAAGFLDDALAAVVAEAKAWMAEPVAYPRLLVCPQTGRPCDAGPCERPWTGCVAVRT